MKWFQVLTLNKLKIMKVILSICLICLFFAIDCQKTLAQSNTGDNVRLVLDQSIVFPDTMVKGTIKAYALGYVSFKDSLTLQPVDLTIQMIRMKGNTNKEVDFIFSSAREAKLNRDEKLLVERYSPKIDSILLNSRYEFVGPNTKMAGRTIAIGFPFEIIPKE